MTLPLIVFKSLRQHALSTIVTALSVALAGGLLMSVWAVKGNNRNALLRVLTRALMPCSARAAQNCNSY